MKLGLFILEILVVLRTIDCARQTCHFRSKYWSEDAENGFKKYYWICQINDATLLDEKEPLYTDVSNNTKMNTDVTALLYWANCNVKYIPITQFMQLFPNLEYLCYPDSVKINNLKPTYFENALSLKVFDLYGNPVTFLVANLFRGAPNLEYINLRNNQIHTIHLKTFNGLSKLKGLYLQGNKIQNLHPMTFSYIASLQSLNLLNNDCINRNFGEHSESFDVVENAIKKTCSFAEDHRDKLTDKKIQEITDKINRLEFAQEAKIQQIMENINARLERAERKSGDNFIVLVKLIQEKQSDLHLQELDNTIKGENNFEGRLKALEKAQSHINLRFNDQNM